jgi:subfamily B ATP-binding cassette protein MsbA
MLRTFWRFRRTVRPYRAPLAVGSALVLVVAATDIAAPWPLKVVVDNVLRGQEPSGVVAELFTWMVGSGREPLLAAAIVGLLALTIINATADYLSTYVLDGIGQRLMADLRNAIFAHLQRQSLHYHDRQRVGDLTTRITSDVSQVQDMLVTSLSVLIPNVTVLLGIVVVMFVVDAEFALLALAVAPVLFLVVFTYTRRIKHASKAARRKESDIASVASETLSAIHVVQAYTSERRHERRFREHNVERLVAGLDAVRAQARLTPAIDVITAAGTGIVLWFGAHRVLDGTMTLGLLLVFLAYLSQLYRPMRSLSKLAWVVSRGQASADRLQELLSVDVRIVERADAVRAPALRGAVQLESVTFGYYANEPVLHDVSLAAAPGETVALAGATGAGKSTLVSLIPRFYDPWDGAVLVDGHDVRSFTVASLRRQIALVLQDSILFHGTIYENIAYGAVDVTEDDVLAAAEAAYVDEFVRQFPDGYATLVSERGTTLSGGQRQRIAIARALVRNAPIVILDEPTSGLDALSERLVLRGLERLAEGRTVFVVAHRLSTLRQADRIYVLEAGRVVDSGTHDELARQPGPYGEMHAAITGVE